ncbi:disease resistance protein RGA5-like [Oryza glaberrima]|uniref:disease resistance protein RGA5-like n=1 Tax=Oryza glaberrima TaxID=4538 RepID=UPI00224C48CF|nr:disease resistance protein RGA5-like [Oryza glaberrima]XP_052135478.1 disease resistance protein RGA5-like [Oryza glaberrima]
MEVVTEAMGTLFPKLANLLTEEYKQYKNLRGQIMFLKAELESMEAALLKISETPIDQPPDNQSKLWARDVKELSYDIEDSVDKFMVLIDTRASNNSFRDLIDRSVKLLTRAKIRYNICIDIEQINSRVKEVSERQKRYKVDVVVAKPVYPTVDSLRLSALYKRAKELVGTDEKSNELVRRLMEGDEMSKKQMRIVSIVGFGGIGKTTIAKVVCERLKMQFDCFAIVSVSFTPNMEKIFKDMLHQLDKDKYSDIYQATWSEEYLLFELREFLQDKRYLIVIDDIWDKSAWERIKYSLFENENGSRIITTTRIHDVARQVGGVYQMTPLSLDDSRKLFYLRIFGAEDTCPNHLAKASKVILRKCGGVPLAIITIASMLASKLGKEDDHMYWSKVCRSMGSGLEDNPHLNDMRRILSINYYDLPPRLKTCLLYLCLYPEDYQIAREHLIRLWVCEGFVHNEQGKSMYQVGEDYFNELINKSLIEPIDVGIDNKAGFCGVHDMVHDLIASLSNKECFVTTLRGVHLSPINSKVRRLSLQTSHEDSLKKLETMSLSHVRSLIVLQEFKLLPTPLSKTFPILRVLCLNNCVQVKNQHVKDICNLFHLRSLDLWSTSITELPKEIKNLRFLKVLYICETKIEELPSTFVQLEQLESLLFYFKMRLPDGFGNLKSLQELGGDIIVDSPTMLDDLGRLTELRQLSIDFNDWWDNSYETAFLQCLTKLTNLSDLQITSSLSLGPQRRPTIDIPDSGIHSIPNWQASLSSVSTLTIQLKTLGEDDLQVLGSLPSLRDLGIAVEEPTLDRDERLTISNAYPFMCLTRFRYSSETIEVVFSKGAMQRLHTLTLLFDVWKTIELFNSVDLGLENLSSLRHAHIYLCNCSGVMPEELEAVENALQKAVDINPNSPSLELERDDDNSTDDDDDYNDNDDHDDDDGEEKK